MSDKVSLKELNERDRDRLITSLVEELPVLRTKLGLSQDELAGILDISRQTYSYMETKRRRMSWSIYLALILLFDNNSRTHGFLRKTGLFPEIIFSRAGVDTDDLIASSLSGFASEDVYKSLDEKAIHAIETVIMLEYARCNGMSSEAVIKAFEGRRPSQFSDKTVKAKKVLKTIETETGNN